MGKKDKVGLGWIAVIVVAFAMVGVIVHIQGQLHDDRLFADDLAASMKAQSGH